MRSLLAITILGSILLTAPRAHAGLGYNESATCHKNSDGSGYCSGTFTGFRTSSDSTAWAAISLYYNSAAFSAVTKGTYYVCTFPYDGSLNNIVNASLYSPNEWFYITWGANGVCTNGSNMMRSSYTGQ